jgi:phospholipid/cholesterol/gamma-HCH transport system substrate-binding protein
MTRWARTVASFRPKTRTPRAKGLLLVAAASLTLSGCGIDVYQLPLPGGTDVGDHPMTVHIMFRDVLDLVPQSSVKVHDVSVGKVTDVSLDGFTADVTVQLQKGTKLPDNAVATIRQTSLLGEKFVDLAAPESGASAEPLQSGDVIPLDRSGRNPEVEEVLGALSLLLNGGGVAQLRTIARELNVALDGREGTTRSVLDQIRTLMTQLDDHKAEIVDAIDKLNALAVSVNQQRDTIDAALDELPSALRSIDKQRDDLVRMLKALAKLSGVGVRVIQASKEATIDSLHELTPVLSQIAASGDDFVNAFNVFLTYPFVDEVVGRDPQVARNLHMGDYTNLSVQLDLNIDANLPTGLPTSLPTGLPTGLPTLPTDLPTSLPTVLDPTVILGDVLACLQSGSITSPECQKVLASPEKLLKLQEECAKPENKDKAVCKQLGQLPSLPTAGTSVPLPTLTTALPTLPTLPTLPGLNRAGVGPPDRTTLTFGRRGPTMRQLMALYDPALVSLLVPGMVVEEGHP